MCRVCWLRIDFGNVLLYIHKHDMDEGQVTRPTAKTSVEKVNRACVYVTQGGFDALGRSHKELQESLRLILAERSSAFKDGGGTWHDNAAFEEVGRQEHMASERLVRVSNELKRAIVVPDRPNHKKFVTVGHVITLESDDGSRTLRYEVGGHGESDPKLTPPRVDYSAPVVAPFFGEALEHEAEVTVGGRKYTLVLTSIEVPLEKDKEVTAER